jgi:hypothetical protein
MTLPIAEYVVAIWLSCNMAATVRANAAPRGMTSHQNMAGKECGEWVVSGEAANEYIIEGELMKVTHRPTQRTSILIRRPIDWAFVPSTSQWKNVK